MDVTETTDQLIIVNRSMEHRISKQLIRKIPYFEKMLSHDLKESKENKVELDFDETAIKVIFDGLINGSYHLKMDYLIPLCNIADYFGLRDSFIAGCVTYFHKNFTIDHLPVVITQVTSTSKLINSGSLNAFICRYFSKIANTNVWLNYPLETIEYICKLDLMIHSEMQVFEAIMRWTSFEYDCRKKSSELLLKLVRWCRLEDKDLSKIKENELFKSLEFNPKFCSDDKNNCVCKFNRTEQEYFVMIEKYGPRPYNLRIIVLANNLQPLFNRILEFDKSLPEHIIHDEYISDIHYVPANSKKKIIRIDWKHNKYRWLDFPAYSYKLLKYISINSPNGESFVMKVREDEYYKYGSSILEAKDEFILISKDAHSFHYWSKPNADKFKYFPAGPGYSYSKSIHMATVLDNKIYMLTKNIEFVELDIDRNCEFKVIELPRSNHICMYYFDNLHLTSKQANDDRVILFDKAGKNVYSFNVNNKRWNSIGLIIDCNFSGDRMNSNVLSFTAAFLSVEIITFA